MPQYPPLIAMTLAFYSKDVYRDAFLRWQGMAFTYLLWLNILLITPAILVLFISINDAIFDDNGQPEPLIDAIIEEVSGQIPKMMWENDELSTDADQPYIISFTIDGETMPLAVIDLDANLGAMREHNAVILLTRDAVHIQKEENQIETRYWSEFDTKSFVLDEKLAREFAQQGLAWFIENKIWLYVVFGTIGWVGTLLVMFFYRVVQVLIFGGIGMLIANYYKLRLEFPDAVRLACLAITPGVITDLVLSLILGDSMSILLFVVITLGYLVFAIRCNRDLETGRDSV